MAGCLRVQGEPVAIVWNGEIDLAAHELFRGGQAVSHSRAAGETSVDEPASSADPPARRREMIGR